MFTTLSGESSCPCGAPSPEGKPHLRRTPALSFGSAQKIKYLLTGSPLARALTLGRVLRCLLLQGFSSLREAGALCPESLSGGVRTWGGGLPWHQNHKEAGERPEGRGPWTTHKG